MPLTRRYNPPQPAGSSATFGMDFSAVVPVGIGIASFILKIFTNTQPPVAADADWTTTTGYIRGRAVFENLSGGVSGKDYLLQWTVTDSRSNVWIRTAALLCTSTA
jgi:hypothetical protein